MKKSKKVKVIDLFCGIWWITRWFVDEGFNVVAGIDFVESCRFWYEKNNNWAKFIHKDIRKVTWEELTALYNNDCDIKILVWCAPCQPFSWINSNKVDYFFDSEKANTRSPLDKFASLIEKTQPHIVSMENVANLANMEKYPAFKHFLDVLTKNWYETDYKIVDTSTYWIPQKRKRLVLLASKLGKIKLIDPTHKKPITLREAIWHLPKIWIGEIHPDDPYHRTQTMNTINTERIKYIPKNWWNLKWAPDYLIPECHKKASWKTYSSSVYARMKWDEPSPTLTTQCLWIWNGRYWHPEQDRAISLREAAMIQTFPQDYEFVEDTSNYCLQKVVKYIGNAVPVKLWQVIAQSIKIHLNSIS